MQNQKLDRMGILIVDPVGSKAGMDYYDSRLADGLRAAGYNTYIASNFASKDTHVVVFEAGKTTALQKLGDWLTGFYKAFSFARKKKVEYVLIHCFSMELKDIYPFVLARVMGLKVVAIAHDVSGFANKDSSAVSNLVYNSLSEFVVVHNSFSKAAILPMLNERMQGRLKVIPHGHFLDLPDEDVSREHARAALQIPHGEKMLLFFGQIKKQKGLDVLIHALRTCEEQITLTIAGRPWKDSFDTYAQLIREFNLEERVRLNIRYITDSERELFFKAADVVVIPYKEIYQSGVLLMGMSYGRLVIASDLQPNKEVITSGYNGLLFESENPEDLAEKINDAFLDPLLRNEMVEHALHSLKEKNSWALISRCYQEFL